ncbi:MAG: UbiX family flavin prenyltransferase, partial [Planctomycetes bacterium]|nr:UbiX family flavin prenyltransferase [Planctomycetota bacterium]
MRSLILAITGASGAVYAQRLMEVLLQRGNELHLTISPAGAAVIKQELNVNVRLEDFQLVDLLPESADFAGNLRYFNYKDLMAPMASGSFLSGGMVICPCSGGTLSAIATGASNNLVQRAADVQLKEGRKLILVPRETPLSLIHLENMKRAAAAGAVILPASPG